MTNEMIIQIAMEQSVIDSNCKVEDFKDLYKAEWSNALCKDRKLIAFRFIHSYEVKIA